MDQAYPDSLGTTSHASKPKSLDREGQIACCPPGYASYTKAAISATSKGRRSRAMLKETMLYHTPHC